MFNLKGSQTAESDGLKLAGGRCLSWRPGWGWYFCLLPHLLLVLPGISRATSPFKACAHLLWARRTVALVGRRLCGGPRCHIIPLCFGKETRQKHNVCWQESVPGSLRGLAWSWPDCWKPSWEPRLFQPQQQPGPGPGPAQPPAQGGGTGWLTEEGPCPFPTYPLTK